MPQAQIDQLLLLLGRQPFVTVHICDQAIQAGFQFGRCPRARPKIQEAVKE